MLNKTNLKNSAFPKHIKQDVQDSQDRKQSGYHFCSYPDYPGHPVIFISEQENRLYLFKIS